MKKEQLLVLLYKTAVNLKELDKIAKSQNVLRGRK